MMNWKKLSALVLSLALISSVQVSKVNAENIKETKQELITIDVASQAASTKDSLQVAHEETADLSAYDMSVNMRKLAVTLGLTFDQMEAVSNIHETFKAEMELASRYDSAKRQEIVDRAIARDLRFMRYILSTEQYRKYQLLLNTTLRNRGLH